MVGGYLRVVVPVLLDVVHAVVPDDGVHLLVAVDLVCHRPEQAAPVLLHLFDHVAFPLHGAVEPAVLLLPLLFAQLDAVVGVLVLGVVPVGSGATGAANPGTCVKTEVSINFVQGYLNKILKTQEVQNSMLSSD